MTTIPRPPRQRHTLKSLTSPHHNLRSTQRSATPGPVRHTPRACEHEDTTYVQPDSRGSSRFPAGRTEHYGGGGADMSTDGEFAQVIDHNTTEHNQDYTETSPLPVKRADSYTELAEKSESSKAPNVEQNTSSHLTSATRARPPTRRISNSEEDRLLGASRSRVPKDAVSINPITFGSSTPKYSTSDTMSRSRKPGGGGLVHPRNDLNNTPDRYGTLRTQSSRGNNVAGPKYSPHFPGHDQDRMVEPKSKRPKVEHHDDDDEIDLLGVRTKQEISSDAYHNLGNTSRRGSVESTDGTAHQSRHIVGQKPPRRPGSARDAFNQVSTYRTIEDRMRIPKSYSANGHTSHTRPVPTELQNGGVMPKVTLREETSYNELISTGTPPHVTDTLTEALLNSDYQKSCSPQKPSKDGYESTARTLAKLGDCHSSPTRQSDIQTNSTKRRRSTEEMESQPEHKKMRQYTLDDADDNDEDELSRDMREFHNHQQPNGSNQGRNLLHALPIQGGSTSTEDGNRAIRVPGLAANSIPKTQYSKTRGKQDIRRKSTVDVGKTEGSNKTAWPLSYFMVSSMPRPQRDGTMKLGMFETSIIIRNQDGLSDYEYETVSFDRIRLAVACNPEGLEVKLVGSRDIKDNLVFWCYLAFLRAADCEEFLSSLKVKASVKVKTVSRNRLVTERTKDEEDAAQRKSCDRIPPELSNDTSTKASRTKVATHRDSATRPTLISQMQTKGDIAKDNTSRSGRLLRGQAPQRIMDESSEFHRETRSSNRLSNQKSVSYAERSLSPENYSKTRGLGPRWVQDVKYPPTGRSKATVRYDDLPKLNEGECLNDNLIEFHMAYCHEDAKKNNYVAPDSVYIFNSFFYSSLTQKTTKRDQINYDSVARWTRTVDLFTYDYVVIPINEDYHWYLAIICNLPSMSRRMDGSLESYSPTAVKIPEMINDLQDRTSNLQLDEVQSKDTAENHEDSAEWPDVEENLHSKAASPFKKTEAEVDELPVKKTSGTTAGSLSSPSSKTTITKRKALGRAPRKYSPTEPIIITLDSLGSSHPTTVHKLRRYIEEEGKAKRSMESKIHNALAGTDSTIPMQQNFVDCGVYTLAYFQKFIKDPKEFTRKFLRREMEAKADWGELDPSALRKRLRDLCQATYQEQYAVSQHEKQIKREARRKAAEATRKSAESNAPAQVEDTPTDSTYVDEHQAKGDPKEHVKQNWTEHIPDGLEGQDKTEQLNVSDRLSEPPFETQDVVDQRELATSREPADLQARDRDENPRAPSEPIQDQGAAKVASRTTRRAITPEISFTEEDRPVEPGAAASGTHTTETPIVTKANPASVSNKSSFEPDDSIFADSQDNSIIIETNDIVCQEQEPDYSERPQVIEETPEPEIHPSSHSEPQPEPPLEPENVGLFADIQIYAEQHTSEYGVPDIQKELFSPTQRKKSKRAHRSSPMAQRTSPRRPADGKRRSDLPNSWRASSNHTIVLD